MTPRVLMLGWEFPPFVTGGLGTACHGLTRALTAAGCEVTFVLPRAICGSHSSHVQILSPESDAVTAAEPWTAPPDAVVTTRSDLGMDDVETTHSAARQAREESLRAGTPLRIDILRAAVSQAGSYGRPSPAFCGPHTRVIDAARGQIARAIGHDEHDDGCNRGRAQLAGPVQCAAGNTADPAGDYFNQFVIKLTQSVFFRMFT